MVLVPGSSYILQSVVCPVFYAIAIGNDSFLSTWENVKPCAFKEETAN